MSIFSLKNVTIVSILHRIRTLYFIRTRPEHIEPDSFLFSFCSRSNSDLNLASNNQILSNPNQGRQYSIRCKILIRILPTAKKKIPNTIRSVRVLVKSSRPSKCRFRILFTGINSLSNKIRSQDPTRY